MRLKRTLLGLVPVLALAGCAHDSYTATLGGPGSGDRMHADVMDCKRQAIHAYHEGRSNAGAVTGAVLGGAIGGALGGAMDASSNTNQMTPSDLKPYIEECMRQKGYEANSDNSP